jgi:hypothetical protein
VYQLKQIKNRSPVDTLLMRHAKIDDKFVERIFQCTSCAACEHPVSEGFSYCHGCGCGSNFQRRQPVWDDCRPAGCKQYDKEHPEEMLP